MAFYEHIYLARQDISVQQVEELTDKIKSIIEENDGKTSRTEYWGLRSLAYKINKNRKAHYTLINVDAPHEAMSEVERQLRINEDILRFMTIRVDELDEDPSVMMQRNDRDSDD